MSRIKGDHQRIWHLAAASEHSWWCASWRAIAAIKSSRSSITLRSLGGALSVAIMATRVGYTSFIKDVQKYIMSHAWSPQAVGRAAETAGSRAEREAGDKVTR
jgi:hypothetical protein